MNTFAYSLDTDIPIPPKAKHSKYPFSAMRPGESFFESQNGGTPAQAMARVSSSAKARSTKFPEEKYAVRTVEGGARCWRIPTA